MAHDFESQGYVEVFSKSLLKNPLNTFENKNPNLFS